MANTQLQQWIVNKLADPNWGSHHKVKIYNPETKTKKEADWLWLYANKKAIIIEDKESGDTDLDSAIKQVRNYEKLINKQGYDDVITIAIKDSPTNKQVKVFHNGKYLEDVLRTISYYEAFLEAKKQINISKEIFNATAKINQILHDEFKITHLQDRMLFTGCILVASKQTSGKFEGLDNIDDFKSFVSRKILSIETNQAKPKAIKLTQLVNLFNSISVGASPNKQLIEQICEICNQINNTLRDNPLTDIDIMNIFFTEFNRYRGKSESGQVFTPDHIAKLMAELVNINKNDHVFDPCCGSGSLLLAASKYNGRNFDNIFGNDFDMNVLRLSYINMLLHNDGVTNLIQMDARDKTEKSVKKDDITFVQFIKQHKITKVIANPPYEQSFPIDILENVLNNVEKGCKVIWLMPNNKMDKIKKSRKLLEKNKLTDIIFLGDIFPKTGCGDVSLFIFVKGEGQQNNKIKCWHIDDQFETVKNQGYQDVKGTWPKIKEEFIQSFEEGRCDKEIDPKGNLSYQKEIKIVLPTKEDFEKTLFKYKMFETGMISTRNTVDSVIDLFFEMLKKKEHKN